MPRSSLDKVFTIRSLVTNQSTWLAIIPAKTRAVPFTAVLSDEVMLSDIVDYTIFKRAGDIELFGERYPFSDGYKPLLSTEGLGRFW